MKIIRRIRAAYRTACGGLVAEGYPHVTSNGRPDALQGAKLACAKQCSIAEGFARRMLAIGRHEVIRGMKTSGECPLLSTSNERDGVVNETGAPVATGLFLHADDYLADAAQAPNAQAYDEQAQLSARQAEGLAYFIRTNDGRTFAGRIGADGLLPRIDTFGEDEYAILWGDEALALTEQSGV